jgi:peptide/nickel transport system permease protein
VTAYIVRRLFHSLLVVLGVSFFVFSLVFIAGDPAVVLTPLEAGPEAVEAFRQAHGLDRPILAQYVDFVAGAVQGDFGLSLRHRQPALEVVLEAVPNTLRLGGFALLLSIIVALPLGILAALKRSTWIDSLMMVLALIGQSVPTFLMGLLLILLLGVTWRLLPISGSGSFWHLLMPGITLAAYSVALIMRLLRSSMLEELNRDYLRTARAKGLTERSVIYKHALRNAAIPVITIIGLRIGPIFSGAVITEEVFAYPGMGRLALNAIANRDLPVVQVFVILVALIITLTNLLVDLGYAALDPRIRYE